MSNNKFINRNSFDAQQVFFWLALFVCLIFATFITAGVTQLMKGCELKSILSVSIIFQDLIAFILPAFLVARFISNNPASFLRLTILPSWKAVAFAVLIFIISMPMLNVIIDWNENITLPESMNRGYEWMRESENAAKYVTTEFLRNNSFLMMLACIFLMGILAGFSEEVLFRGALLNIFVKRPVNIHVSIWTVAIIFSVMHFQFFGFVPRMLLGAFFGYLVYWSGSLWTAIIAHALNNSTVVISSYITGGNGSEIDTIGIPADGSFPALALISLILTAFLIYKYRYFFPKK